MDLVARPIRHGKHQNDAFGLLLLHRAFGELGRVDVTQAVAARALDWLGDDGPGATADEPPAATSSRPR